MNHPEGDCKQYLEAGSTGTARCVGTGWKRGALGRNPVSISIGMWERNIILLYLSEVLKRKNLVQTIVRKVMKTQKKIKMRSLRRFVKVNQRVLLTVDC